MTITKKKITRKISTKNNLLSKDAEVFLNSFLNQLITKTRHGKVKIHNFGSFSYNYTPERIGRNPKTKESFNIKSFKKLVFKPSKKIKNVIN